MRVRDDADLIIGGGRASRASSPPPKRRTRAIRDAPRSRGRAEPRRPGVLVARRIVSRRLARAAPPRHSRLARARAARLDEHRRLRSRRGLIGRGGGRRRTSISRRTRSARGCTQQGMRWFPAVGWAERWRGRRERAGEQRPALSRHVGHRPWRPRAVRAARARARDARVACSSCSAIACAGCTSRTVSCTASSATILEPTSVQRGESELASRRRRFRRSTRRP